MGPLYWESSVLTTRPFLQVVNYFRKNFNLYKGLYNVFRYIKNWCEKVIYFLNIGTLEDRKSQNSSSENFVQIEYLFCLNVTYF